MGLKRFQKLRHFLSSSLCMMTAVAACLCGFHQDAIDANADSSDANLTHTKTYAYTGGVQYYNVSTSGGGFGPGTYVLELYGGAGGDSGNYGAGTANYSGGKGGYVKVTLDLSDGDVLAIGVGGRGAALGDNAYSPGNENGFGSGGGHSHGNRTGAGGGATEIRLNGTGVANRLAVAGGGGGAAQYAKGSGFSGGDAGVYGSGNTGAISGGTSSIYGGGGGGGYYGGSAGTNAAASHGGSNYVNTGRVTAVNSNTTSSSVSAGYVVVTRMSHYICRVDPNGGVLDGSTEIATYSKDLTLQNIGYTTAGTYYFDASTSHGITVAGAGSHAVHVNRSGYYYLELFGAAGGADASRGGNGGYVRTYAYLNAGQWLYIGNGQQGYSQHGDEGGQSHFYGGGARAGYTGSNGNWSGTGGGATSIALSAYGDYSITSYNGVRNEVLAVAGGGAGGSANSHGEGGVVLFTGSGYSYSNANGASTYRLNGQFGYGSTPGGDDGGGGGGGFIGGVSGLDAAGHPAGGGASFCNTSRGCIPIGLIADYNSGSGYVRISYMNDMIALNTPTREGYTFTGYAKNGPGTLSGNAFVSGVYTFVYGEGITNIVAGWTPNPVYGHLNVNPNGGTWNGQISVTEVSKPDGTAYTVADPVRYGYDFAGWTFSGGGTWNDPVYTFASGQTGTLTANWTLHKSSLVVDPNSGHFADGTMTVRTYEDRTYGSTQFIETPSKTGYQFTYWLEQYGSDGYLDESSNWHFATSNAYLKADWDANTYYVKYVSNKPALASNQVTGSQPTQTVRYDQTFNLNTNSECAGGTGFSLIGWHFTGWNTKADGTGTWYGSGQSVINLTTEQLATYTLYAQWEQNTYTIKYDKNTGEFQSGTDGTETTVILFEDAAIDLQDVSSLFYKTGYHIESPTAWLFGSVSGTAYPETVTSDATYVAPIKNAIRATKSVTSTVYVNWIENTYTIHFDKNTPTRASSSVQGTMADMSDLLWTRDHTLTANNFSLTGWTFKGWALSSTDYSTITPGDFASLDYGNSYVINNKNDTKLSDEDKVVITLYAVWQENRYTIKFDGNNDIGTVVGQTPDMVGLLYESDYDLTENLFGRTSPVNMEYRDGEWRNVDSTFLGWNYSVDDGQTVIFLDKQSVKKLSPMNNSVVQLYAVWNDNPTFDIKTEFPDRYFTVADAQAGVITEEELLSTVTASDREGLSSIELVGYEAAEYSGVMGPAKLSQTYKVTDTYGRISYVTITVYILENDSAKAISAQEVRGYDGNYYKQDGQFVSAAEGGLAETSRWLTDDAYNMILEQSVYGMGDANNIVYSFSSKNIADMKSHVTEKGIGTNAGGSLAETFLNYVKNTQKQK